MILDTLAHASLYGPLHPQFGRAFEFLNRPDLHRLPDGKVELDGQRLFVIVARGEGRGRESALLEAHRKYIDIQYVADGADDSIGWRPTNDCQRVSQPYDEQSDLEFYFDRPETWLSVRPGAFCIFFPQDAHAPLAMQGRIHKLVVKIAV